MSKKLVRHHFSKVDSTNSCAKRNAHLFNKEELTLITADEQLAGRGRTKRSWLSPASGNIYATYTFFIDSKREDLGNLTQVMAISASSVLEKFGVKPRLKWPNDLLIERKKIGGILAETTLIDGQLSFMLGIGLNVNMDPDDLEALDQPATSLYTETGKMRPVEQVIESLTTEFQKNLEIFLENGFKPFIEIFRDLMHHLESVPVHFHDHATIWKGVIDSINDDGSLNLRLQGGEIKTFRAGQILDSDSKMVKDDLVERPTAQKN